MQVSARYVDLLDVCKWESEYKAVDPQVHGRPTHRRTNEGILSRSAMSLIAPASFTLTGSGDGPAVESAFAFEPIYVRAFVFPPQSG